MPENRVISGSSMNQRWSVAFVDGRSAELSVLSLICGNTLTIGPTLVGVNAGMQNGTLPIPSVLLVLTSRFTVASASQSAAESRITPNVRRFNA